MQGRFYLIRLDFMIMLPAYWYQVIVDTALRLGFKTKKNQLILDGVASRVVFYLEQDMGGLSANRKGEGKTRYLMDELDCLDFCQWLRRFTHRFDRTQSL